MGNHGQGTIVELPNGRFRIAVTMSDGRRVWRRARTPVEARRIRRELVDARELDLDPSRQTLAEWLRSWIASLRESKRKRIAPTTLRHYEMIVEQHIIPAMGVLPIAKVTERRIQAWLDADPGSPRTIHHHRAVLRAALNRAVRQQILPRNPAAGRSVELPDATFRGSRPLTADEAHRLLEATEGTRWHALWRTAIASGLRLGELLGLTWDDIDGGAIAVHSQLQRLGGSWVRRATKSSRRMTRVALDPGTVAVLERHREQMAAERQPGWRYFGHVFLTEHGDPPHGKTILTAFHVACDAAGIPRRRFHDLRGTSATLMVEAGIPEDVRMARLGHETTAMARRYGKASERADLEAVTRLMEAIG